MKRTVEIFAWLLLAAAGAALLAWAFPRVFPFVPERWAVDRDEAVAIALARFEDLGPPVADPYLVTTLSHDEALERRLWLELREKGAGELPGSDVAGGALTWQVTVFAPGARPDEWTYRATVAPSGEVTALRRGMRADEGEGETDPAEARRRADAFLTEQGLDPAAFAEPEIRTRQLDDRTDLTLRYRNRRALLGEAIPYGVEVAFAGTELLGFSRYLDDPEAQLVTNRLQGYFLLQQIWLFLPVIVVPVVGIFFLRRYHAGEVGVRRGLKIFAVSSLCGIVFLLLCARMVAAGWGFGATQQQLTWIASFQLLVFYFLPLAAIAFLAWSVGEALCRERSPGKLAAFDALFRGRLGNVTVARDSLRGIAAGVALAGGVVGSALLAQAAGAWAPMFLLFGPWSEGSSWFGIAMVAFTLPSLLYRELFGRLLLVSALARRLGRWAGGALAALVAAFIFFPPLMLVPLGAGQVLGLAMAAASVVLFLRYGLAMVLLSSATATLLLDVYPFLVSGHPWLQFQACLPLVVVALPLLVSFRHLTAGEEFTYRYDDVPPHVRRIAERERQRIELETARRIQSSILPELPASLHGVEIAHSYLPATEVEGTSTTSSP